MTTLNPHNTVTGTVDHSMFPSKQEELLRDVILKGPFHVTGGILAQNISNSGGGIVDGPVFATSEVTMVHPQLDGNGGGALRLNSGVSATLSISTREQGLRLEDTVVADHRNASIIIRGDILSKQVKIENALVFGNIRADNIVIKNSLVIGSLVATENITIENSLFLAFTSESGKVELRGANTCWLPYGRSKGEFVRTSSKLSSGQEVESSLRYLPLCRTEALGCEFSKGCHACTPYISGSCQRPIRLSEADITHQAGTASQGDFYTINIARRALNLEPIEREINSVKLMLSDIMIYDHLDAHSRDATHAEWSVRMSVAEMALARVAVGLDHTTSI